VVNVSANDRYALALEMMTASRDMGAMREKERNIIIPSGHAKLLWIGALIRLRVAVTCFVDKR
jgi:hypothetical protein